jgi:hypothetical protein
MRHAASIGIMICQEADLSQLSTGLSDEERRGATPRLSHDDDEVMTLRQWWERNSLSRATAQRILARGEGPDITWLSAQRRGVTYGADRRWKAARQRPSGK